MLYWVTLNVAHQIAYQSDRSSCSFATNWSLSSATRSLRANRAELYGTLLLVAARYDRFFVIGHRSLGLVRLRLLRFLAASALWPSVPPSCPQPLKMYQQILRPRQSWRIDSVTRYSRGQRTWRESRQRPALAQGVAPVDSRLLHPDQPPERLRATSGGG